MLEVKDPFEIIIAAQNLLRENGEVVELRILNTKKGTVSGYFDNMEALADAALLYDGDVEGIYSTLNPVKSDLLARANNRMEEGAKHTTSDADIERRMWIMIDFDPVRASGISSLDVEHEGAIARARRVQKMLRKAGWTDPFLFDSSNGAHLLYPIDMPNDDYSRDIIKQLLGTLDWHYSDAKVCIDTSVYNAARICKVYGTKSCKGDDTDERPHRFSGLLEQPETIGIVSAAQIEAIIEKLQQPNAEAPKKEKNVDATPIDLEAWVNQYELGIAVKGRWQNKADKYVLKTCPWNEEHTNRSAYILQFDNGAIAAGCHHNSCQGKGWRELRSLYEPLSAANASENQVDEKVNQAQLLIRLGEDSEYFRNEIGEAYAKVPIGDHFECLKVKSKRHRLLLTKTFYELTGKAPSDDAMKQALSIMEMKATFEGDEYALERRVASVDNVYYYDLANENRQVVKVMPNRCEIISNAPTVFVRTNNMKAQVNPIFPGDLKLLLNHVNIRNDDDQILFLVYTVSCFIPSIPHPVLVLSGEKGASKSTTMRMIRSIVDPAACDILSMPNSKQDLAIVLSNNYMPAFDNLDVLSAEKSDLLCIASTGGGVSKRTLFTDEDETIFQLLRCIVLNGINIVATRADLLDRSLIVELERIEPTERKAEKDVWNAFEQDKPAILGGALTALSKAMAIYPDVKLESLSRMADFTQFGYAIAEALGYGGERFLEAYRNNQNKANDEAVGAHPVAAAVIALMKRKGSWHSSISELLERLESVAITEKINTLVPSWPKAAHALTRRLNEVKSNLQQIGIRFDIRHGGDAKMISIVKEGGEIQGVEGTNHRLPRPRPSLKTSPEMQEMFDDSE
ncbi:hypothetical protein [Paenibacillus odorifer]|uniref:hypothetical protein n=1 Tax=Paenibacillus TaxID=44249 RepID=UPI00096DA5BD|nr:hypothetical protein [Paenibacillus odorifer]OMC98858.1 hypothetical protein BJP46_03810 [Paenibacillus odorifer]